MHTAVDAEGVIWKFFKELPCLCLTLALLALRLHTFHIIIALVVMYMHT